MSISYKAHTADIYVEIKTRALAQLFEKTVMVMCDILYDDKHAQAKTHYKITMSSDKLDELYHDFLANVLTTIYNFNFLVNKVKVNIKKRRVLSAIIYGQEMKSLSGLIKREIKAVTYHRLRVEKIKRHWLGSVIFDI